MYVRMYECMYTRVYSAVYYVMGKGNRGEAGIRKSGRCENLESIT